MYSEKPVKKTLYTLNVGGNYAPEITAITYPLLRRWAAKNRWDFQVLTERKYPDWPITYSKLQVFDIEKEAQSDWVAVIDGDTLCHPETPDITEFLHKDTVAHNGNDLALNRWTYDNYFRRDGRHIGSCNWFTFASDWCLDLWHPLDDITLEQALSQIHPTVMEGLKYVPQRDEKGNLIREKDAEGKPTDNIVVAAKAVITPEHLIDDFTLSRNIARYGLKFDTFHRIQERMGDKGSYLWHAYLMTEEEKVANMRDVLDRWNLA